MDKHILVYLAITMIVSTAIAIQIPTTKQIPYEDTEVYYVDVPYQKPVYKTVEHSDPIYETVERSNPIYQTAERSEPVYETLYTFTLKDELFLDYDIWTLDNVYKFEKTYTGTDFWDNSNYNIKLYYYTSLPDGSKTYQSYNEINSWSTTSYEKIVTYNKWDEQVVAGYDTWTEEVVIGYDTETEEVIDHHETAYRPEKRYRTVTKYKAVTKTVYKWIDIAVNGKTVRV